MIGGAAPAIRATLPSWVVVFAVLLVLIGLPLAVWLDLRNLAGRSLTMQASDLNSVISSVRSYYASNIVARVLSGPGHTQVVHNYASVPGAIPIPATLSLELGKVVGEKQGNIAYRFVSDYPFAGRPPHELDLFERTALASLRRDPAQEITDVSWSGLNARVRLVAPVVMTETCVSCHNSHPESPKRDWRVGDVRGIQEVVVDQPIVANLSSFRSLIAYFSTIALFGFGLVAWQNRQSRVIAGMNRELTASNAFLAAVSQKLSRYFSPELYRRIFSGETEVAIRTERKKLTIFFSDIEGFTAAMEQLQPEEITGMLNEYFTEMSNIAARYGGTFDKFIGDAVLIFFGDPETKGIGEDARACLRMAFDMKSRIAVLNAKWRREGIAQPFLVRMGISTGFCNVGNFGSEARMDYTIVGAEVNLAARLQSIAEPGQIVVSSETYALVREAFAAHALSPVQVKGIRRSVIPYVVDGALGEGRHEAGVLSEHAPGLDLYLDPSVLDREALARTRSVLQDAVATLDSKLEAEERACSVVSLQEARASCAVLGNRTPRTSRILPTERDTP